MTQSDKKLTASDDLALEALNSRQDDDINDELAASNEIAETLEALQGLVERSANKLDEIKAKLKEQRNSLKNIFDNDGELSEANEEAQRFSKQVRERKSVLVNDPTVVRLKTDIAELNEQKKEIEEALSGHLLNYYKLTDSKSIDTADGDQREFVLKATIKPKRKS